MVNILLSTPSISVLLAHTRTRELSIEARRIDFKHKRMRHQPKTGVDSEECEHMNVKGRREELVLL